MRNGQPKEEKEMSESRLQSDIITALMCHDSVAWAMAISSGSVKVKGGYLTIGQYVDQDMKRKTGVSDILGQMRSGAMLAIECKMPGKKPTQEQVEFIDMVRRNGGVAGWATTVTGAYEIIDLELTEIGQERILNRYEHGSDEEVTHDEEN